MAQVETPRVQKDPLPKVVLHGMACAEMAGFVVDRVFTIALTFLWIDNFESFCVSMQKVTLFNSFAILSCVVFLHITALYFSCFCIHVFMDALNQEDQQGFPGYLVFFKRNIVGKGWTLERRAFWIERFGMLLLYISCLPLGLPCILSLAIGCAPCTVLFPVANILYSWYSIFGDGSDDVDQKQNKLEERKLSAWEEKLATLEKWAMAVETKLENLVLGMGYILGKLAPVWAVIFKVLMDIYTALLMDEADEYTAILMDEADNESEQSAEENECEEETEWDSVPEQESNIREYDNLPELEEAKEAEEEGNDIIGLEADKAFSEESFELLETEKRAEVEGDDTIGLEAGKAFSEESFELLETEKRAKVEGNDTIGLETDEAFSEESLGMLEAEKGAEEEESDTVVLQADNAVSEASFEMPEAEKGAKEDGNDAIDLEADKAFSEGSFEMPEAEKGAEEEGTDAIGLEADKSFSEENFEMPEAEKRKEEEGNNTNGLEADKAISEERFKMPVIDDHDQARKRILQIEEDFGRIKEDYVKELKKIKDKLEKKRQKWKEQKHDLISRLSATASQAEFYRLQARESEEIRHKLEGEKNDMMMKLCAANASCELYRSLLHEQDYMYNSV